MKLVFEIVPGESIGPFRLGMSFHEIDETVKSLTTEPITLEALAIVAWCKGKKGKPEPVDRCNELGVRVVSNQHTILLCNQSVNDISNKDAIRLFEPLDSDLEHSYGGFDAPNVGLQAVR